MSNKTVLEQMAQAINSHDASAAAQLYTENATYMLPGAPEPLLGRAAIKESYEVFFRAFPDFKMETTLSMESGEHIFREGVCRGTHTGPLTTSQGDVAPTGKKMELRFAFVVEITPEGLIAEDRTYFDSAVMMSQLGLS